jgi:hypothetical protein
MIERLSWRHAAALLLPPGLFLVLYALRAPDVSLMQPDSASYLTFAIGRSGGYPAFLALLKPLIRDVADYTIAQRVLYAFAVLVLGHQLWHVTSSLTIALVAEVALLFNPEVNRYHFMILTESLFLSTSALFMAAALAYLRGRRLGALAAACALAAFATALRPSSVVLLPLLAVLFFAAPRWPWRESWKPLLAGAVPVVLILVLEGIYYRDHHEGPRVSLAPIHLLAKAGLVESANAEAIISAASPETRPLQRALEVSLAPVRRLIAEAPSRSARCKLMEPYEEYVQRRFALEERAAATAGASDNLLIDVALARLKNAVGGYSRLTAAHLQCLWSMAATTQREQVEFGEYLESRRPIPFQDAIVEGLSGMRSPPFPTAVLIVMYSIAALLFFSAAALIAVLIRGRRPSTALAIAGFAGLMVHALVVFTAMAGIGLPRYVLGLWVPIAVGVGMSVLWLIGALGWRQADQTGMRR